MRPLLLLLCLGAVALMVSPALARENEGGKPTAAEPAPSPRVLLIGNEMMRDANITFLLHALMQSAGWQDEGVAAANHSDPAHPSNVYEHYHDGYTLGPNPWSDAFDPSAYELFDPAQTDLTAAAAAGLTDTDSRTDMPERSRISVANLLRPSPQRARINAAWKAQSDLDLGTLALNPILTPQGTPADPFALVAYRQRFGPGCATATSERPTGSEPVRKQIEWAPYDTEQLDPQARGFHGQPVAGAGVGVFTGAAPLGSLLLTPANASWNPPPRNSKQNWPELFPETFALNVWLKIDQLPSRSEAGAFAGAILDCRPAVADANASALAQEDGSVIQLRIVVTEPGAAPRMQFRYTSADGTEQQSVLSPPVDASDPSDSNALVTNKWEMWSVNFQKLDAPSSMVMYRGGLQVAENNVTASDDPKYQPWSSPSLLTVPQVPRVCQLGSNASPNSTAGGGSLFKGRMADLGLWADVGLHPNSVKKMYMNARPLGIKLDKPPRVTPIVLGGVAPPEEEGAAPVAAAPSRVRSTPLAHAFCANTLKLFDRTAHPLDWGVVVLSDHVLAPFAPWWFRHSLLPGLEILADAILRHSPRARILLLEGWAPGAEALSRDLELASIKSYAADKVAAAAAGAPKEAAQAAADREIFAALSDSWTASDVRLRIQSHYRRAQQFLVTDAQNYAYDYGAQRLPPVDSSSVAASDLPYAGLTLLSASNFEVLPVLSAWESLAAKALVAVPPPDGQTPTDDAADMGWGKRPGEFFAVAAEDPPPSPPAAPVAAANLELGRVSAPSGLGAFVLATQLFTAITLRDASATCEPNDGSDADAPPASCAQGFCPCTLSPLPMAAPVAPTFAAQLTEQRKQSAARCALVRIASAESFAASFPPAGSSDDSHDFSAPFVWVSAGPADAEQALCNLPPPPPPAPVSMANASSSSSSSTGADEEMGVPTNVNPGPDDSDWNNGQAAEEPGVGEEPSLAPVWAAVVILFFGVVGVIAWFFFRRNRLRWQLLDSRGYEDSDKTQFDMEANSAPAAIPSPSRGPQADAADEDGL